MGDDPILPLFPEVCTIHKLDANMGIGPADLPFLMQSLLVHGWIWRMPAKYQNMAVQLLRAGVIKDVPKIKTKESDMAKRARIKVTIKNGEAIAIKASGDVVDVEVVDVDNHTSVQYSSLAGDETTIWLGGDDDDDCPFDPDPDPDPMLENN
jgi:hypothetical protein